MTILGAIFAGGAGRRFGSDKATALLDGRPLLDHVRARLRPQCDSLVVVGRIWPDLPSVSDCPGPNLGPLGALAGALVHAREQSFAEVLTSGCDLPDLPENLCTVLAPGPSFIAGQPLLGRWPAALADQLLAYIRGNDDRSMRGWISASSARTVAFDRPIANINRIEDLDLLRTMRIDRWKPAKD